MNQSLQNWIADNLLTVNRINDKILEIEGVGRFLIVEPKTLSIDGEILKDKIFDDQFQLTLSDSESELTDNVDFLLFQFGNNWYYTNDLVPEDLKPFRYIGKPKLDFPEYTFPLLAIHAGFELCNGSRLYEDWCKKAKFLGIDTLGIAEENTLAGTLAFQEDCKKKEIKSIIGETVTVLAEDKSKFHIKLYVQNEEGWKNLLLINKAINVDNGGEYIHEWQLWMDIKTDGLVCVLSPEVNLSKYLKLFQEAFKCLYFQIDFVEWSNSTKDEEWLKSLKNYLTNHFQKGLEPILIPDAYYLEQKDYEIKKVLNNIGKVGFKNSSKDQHFKSIDEIYNQALSLFSDEDTRIVELMDAAIGNSINITKEINFQIPVGFFRLPLYEMNEDEREIFSDNEDLFNTLIYEGLESKVIGIVKNEKTYIDRLNEEIEVIKAGGFIDYFLILADIINWCRTQGIWYGIGRGSAAGSLVSYLLGIVGIDPLEYGLLFSRFLNKGRLGKSLPDIDMDFAGERRDEVKRYMESKYGNDYVTAIGTYGTFKAKGAIKDFAREKGIDFSKTNFITSLLPKVDKPGEELEFTDLFKKYGVTNTDFKKYIQKYPQIFELIPLVLNQPKTSSIHASGVVIVPKQYGSIYEQMPVKKVDGLLVSEWEGEIIDKSGFLKCDILGVKQLDKVAAIAKLVKENHNETITFEDIELDDPSVFELFKEGLNEDTFQFGTTGLKSFCREMKPDNINDLIAAVALYRPGTMENGLHKKYVNIKNGKEKPEYDEGTYEATKETFGIAVYQEQVMQITVDVAGFDLVQADDVRKAMGKKDRKLLDEQKVKFIKGGRSKGYKEDYLSYLWSKLETFAGYGFNKSHAAAYAITGYYTQWLKVNYPLEFWTVSLHYAKEEEIIDRIAEINKISKIQVASVDINKSIDKFFSEQSTNTIYWAINSVKWVGEKALNDIMTERNKNGSFYSLEEFCERIAGTKVNKRCIINLILAGAFDKIEKISTNERSKLLERFTTFTGSTLPEDLQETNTKKWKEYQWVLKQKELTGFGYIDYSKIVAGSNFFAAKQKKYLDISTCNSVTEHEDYNDVVIAGILTDLKVWQAKAKNGYWANIGILDNTETIRFMLWKNEFEKFGKLMEESVGKIVIVNGKMAFDDYRQLNKIDSTNKTIVEVI